MFPQYTLRCFPCDSAPTPLIRPPSGVKALVLYNTSLRPYTIYIRLGCIMTFSWPQWNAFMFQSGFEIYQEYFFRGPTISSCNIKILKWVSVHWGPKGPNQVLLQFGPCLSESDWPHLDMTCHQIWEFRKVRNTTKYLLVWLQCYWTIGWILL